MDFLAYIPAIHFVQNAAKRGYIVLNIAVNSVIERNIAHLVLGEKFFDKLSGLQVVPSQAGKVFGQDHIEHPALHRTQHPLKVGAVHVQSSVTVILENPRHPPALFLTIAAQKFALILDTGAGAAEIVVFGKTAVDSCSHLLRVGFSIHSVSPHL